MNIEDLKTKGFVTLPYPAGLRSAVEKARESWKKFYSLPADVKRGLPYSNGGVGVGYELKEGTGPKGDRKENFDVSLSGKQWLETHAENIGNSTALEFIQNAAVLVGLVKPIIMDFALQSEQAFNLPGFGQEVSEGDASYFIRFIRYPEGAKVGEEVATAHTDQSGFGPHLFESTPGLQCYTFEKEWIPMPVSDGETVIIPSMQMQLRSDGQLKALCHRVVVTEESAVSGRDSAVCFVQLSRTSKYDKEKNGRLQEMEPGFNYEMPQRDFEKLFKR